MKIIELQVENVKRVDAVWLQLGPGANFIGGNNEQGKTSVIDAIEMGLDGEKAIPPDPIHHGKKRAKIKIDLGELVAERVITPKGSTLVLKAADGQPLATPQAILNKLAAKLNFDPLAFVHLKPKEQLDALREVVGLDFTELNEKREKLYEERKEVNRHLKDTVAQRNGMTLHQGAPDKPVDITALTEEHGREKAINEERAQAEKSVALLRSAYIAARDKGLAVQAAAKVAADETKAAAKALGQAETKYEQAPSTDETEIVQKIADAGEVNQQVADNVRYKEAGAKADNLQEQSDALSDGLQAIDDEKSQMIEAAKLPIPGLSFDDEQVILDDVPFCQASSAQQLRASVAILAATNPGLKLALIRDGSRLDAKNLVLLDEFCTEYGIQAVIERVGHGKECQVIIEDGRARGRTPEDAEAQ